MNAGTIGMIALIARREITTRVQQRGFRIGLAVMLVIVALACLVPKFLGGHSGTSYDIGVSGDPALGAAIATAGRDARLTVHVHDVPAEQAERKVRSGSWDVAVSGNRIVASNADSTAVALVQQAHSALAVHDQLRSAGLTEAQVAHAFTVAPLTVSAVHSSDEAQRKAIAMITVIVLFAQLIGFCSWVGMGVVEEKASRVVELLLSAVRPLQLLTGKLLGIGAVAVGQIVLIAAVALGVSDAAGTLHVPGVAYITAAISFGWFILGFAFFSALSAALASLVSRQEEVSGVLAPVTALLMVAYLGSFAATGAPDSTAARVLSMVPPLSAIAMPARIAAGAPVLDVVISVLLMLVLTVAILAAAGRIYRAAILHAGSKLSLRRAWRAEPVSEL